MVDIHSHILPAIDDGSDSLETSQAMLRMAAAAGTTDIVATPHANLQYRYDAERVNALIAEVQQACGETPRIHRGCDFHLSYDNIQDCLRHPSTYTINGKSYLLVEFSDLQIAKITDDVFQSMRERGITPIITHPERNPLLQKRLDQIATWVNSGCLVQITAQSLLGRFGKTARGICGQLLERRLVHFVASDAHDTRHRPPVLDRAFRHLADTVGEQDARVLCEINPRSTLSGNPIEIDDPMPAPGRRKWFQFWS